MHQCQHVSQPGSSEERLGRGQTCHGQNLEIIYMSISWDLEEPLVQPDDGPMDIVHKRLVLERPRLQSVAEFAKDESTEQFLSALDCDLVVLI